jgi:hypothetical protein
MTVDDEERKRMNHNSVSITGGTFSGNTAFGVGDRATASVGSDPGRGPTRDDLGAALKTVRDELVAAGSTPGEQQVIADQLRQILAELGKDSPAPKEVRSRWNVVASIVGAAATAGTAIAETTGKISDMITAVLGA